MKKHTDTDQLTVIQLEQGDTLVAVMFADLSGSTRLYETLGDSHAKFLVTDSLRKLSETVTRHDGKVIKTIGDELMCTFKSAHEAVQASRSMVMVAQDVDMLDMHRVAGMMHLRVGIHYGTVIQESNDVFGDTVNVAARLVSIAKSNSIFVSDTVASALPEDMRSLATFHDTVVVRGKTRPVDVFVITTGVSRADDTVNIGSELSQTVSRLTLYLKARHFEYNGKVTKDKPMLTIGRGKQNDLVVEHNTVSREHARIDFKQGKYYITDYSSNGTYIELNGGSRTLLKKSDYNLVNSGVLYLGEEPGRKSPTAIEFEIEV